MTPTDTRAHASGAGEAIGDLENYAPCRRTPAPPPLELLFRRWQRDGDDAAREALVRQFLPLARRLARRYSRSSEPMDDLEQVAALALLRALDRFDTDHGSEFVHFAVPTILGELRRYFRDSGWRLRVHRGEQERALKVRDAQEQLAHARGRAPTVSQLAEHLEYDLEDVLDALQTMQAYEPVSLDAPRVADDGEGRPWREVLGHEDDRLELVELYTVLSDVLAQIEPRDRLMLRMRFLEDLTQSEIAARVGISQMQVSRRLRNALDLLRAMAGTESTRG